MSPPLDTDGVELAVFLFCNANAVKCFGCFPGYFVFADILQDLKNVVNVTGMSLSDAERLAIIDQSYKRLLEYRNLVQYYTDKNISVSYLRAKKKKDADRVVALYGDAEDRYW